MTATEELRRMLDERGVEWWQKKRHTCWKVGKGQEVEMWRAWEAPDGSITLKVDYIYHLTPEQAIAATLGNEGVVRSNDGVAELEAGTCRRVYLVEVSDDLIESWCPLSVYLHREAAEDCAEALRKEEGGIWQFARVSELKVVDDG